MRRLRESAAFCLPAGLAVCLAVGAQEAPREVVLPYENVRYDYAQVLSVRPVYQTLRTTSMERVCGSSSEQALGATLARVMDAVRERSAGAPAQDCRMEPVAKEHRRTIAYDVDYMYRGSKFRSRMDRDPGNRLRIRISIAPRPAD